MSPTRFTSAVIVVAASLAPSVVLAGHDQSLYQNAVFPSGHWIGQGTSTVTHAGSGQSSEADGSFNFDLTIKNGVATGTMSQEISGSSTRGPVVATFQGISAGSGYTLSGNAGRVVMNGTLNYTGTVTGRGHSFPIHLALSVSGGAFAPDEYSCNTASGNFALPVMQQFAATNTTISYPWTAVNIGKGSTFTKAQAKSWLDTMDSVEADTTKEQEGDAVLNAVQARALIERAQIVISAFTSAEKCQGGSHLSVAGETDFQTFQDDMKYLVDKLKTGGFK